MRINSVLTNFPYQRKVRPDKNEREYGEQNEMDVNSGLD